MPNMIGGQEIIARAVSSKILYDPTVLATVIGLLGIGLAWHYRRHLNLLKQLRIQHEDFSRRIIQSQEEERKRIARYLHDGLGHDLLLIKNRLYLLHQSLPTSSPQAKDVNEVSECTVQAIDEVRKISQNLRPYQLDRLGLTKALKAEVGKTSRSIGIAIEGDIDDIDRLFHPDDESNLFRIAQESLTNLVKHACPTQAIFSVGRKTNRIHMKIQDNGCGFDPLAIMRNGKSIAGFGLQGLRERIRLIGGEFRCDSTPGQGAQLHITVPIPTYHE